MAKPRCEWDSRKCDPATQKLHEFLDVLEKTAKEAFGSEAQQFIDKAIYAKMPDHVKKSKTRKSNGQSKNNAGTPLKVIHAENLKKRKIAGMEPTRQTIRELNDTSKEKGTRKLPPNNRQPTSDTNQKTSYAAPAFQGNSRYEGVFIKRSPHYLRR